MEYGILHPTIVVMDSQDKTYELLGRFEIGLVQFKDRRPNRMYYIFKSQEQLELPDEFSMLHDGTEVDFDRIQRVCREQSSVFQSTYKNLTGNPGDYNPGGLKEICDFEFHHVKPPQFSFAEAPNGMYTTTWLAQDEFLRGILGIPGNQGAYVLIITKKEGL